MVRVLCIIMIAAALLAIAGSAFAYRLIIIPVAEVLPDGMYKIEYSGPFNDHLTDKWLMGYRFDYSMGKGFEIATKSGCDPSNTPMPGSQATGTDVNLNWQIAKETKTMPGYGVGVWNWYDSDDHVAMKESFFGGIFKSFDVGMKFPIKVHLLAGTKQLNGMFGGVLIPLSKRCQMAAEYAPHGTTDTKWITLPGTTSRMVYAIGYNQTPNWRFKYANVGGDSAWGVVYTSHWKNMF